MNTDSPGGDASDLFLALTPDRVLSAVEQSGVACNGVCYPLNSFENRVYEVEREDRSRVVAKFYRPGRWTDAQILEEHAFLRELSDAEIPVCPPLLFPDGGTLRRIDNIHYALFPRTGGRVPEELDHELCERLGMLVARIHNVGSARDAKHRQRLSAEQYARVDLEWLSSHKVIPPSVRDRYLRVAHALTDAAEARLDSVPNHRIHGDLHTGNLLLRDNVLCVLDFDDMMVGPAVQDVWLLLPGRDAESESARETFLRGYEQLRAFDRSTLGLVEHLRALRLIHYAVWLARRFHDPIFPRTFVHFGTESYWIDQARDLEDLAEVIRCADENRAHNRRMN